MPAPIVISITDYGLCIDCHSFPPTTGNGWSAAGDTDENYLAVPGAFGACL
jgi:hypothetical protein